MTATFSSSAQLSASPRASAIPPPLLDLIGQPDAEFRTETQQFQKMPCMPPPGHNHNFSNPCIYKSVQGVIDHRLVITGRRCLLVTFVKRI